MKNPKKELFQENSMTFQGLLSNLPIFQDAFPGLKPIPELSRTLKDFPGLLATLITVLY